MVFNDWHISLKDKDRKVLRISKEGLNFMDSTFEICKGRSNCFNKTTNR